MIMTNTLHLIGNDAISFAHSFFFPSAEAVKEQKERRAERNRNIRLQKTEDGFSVEINDAFLK